MKVSPGVLVAALGATQVLGWGGSYFMPGVLGGAIERDLGLPPGGAFAGIALMLGLSGLLAPMVGRAMDQVGARPALASGSFGFAAGMAMLGLAQNMAQGLVACLVLGVAGALALTEAAQAAIASLGAERARKRMGLLTLMSGLSSAIAWPVLALLEARYGWRGAVLATAAAHLLVALPLHLGMVPAIPRGARPPRPVGGALPARLRWLSAAFTVQVLVASAVLANMVALLESLGLDRGTAIFWASFTGPAQIASRMLDVLGGGRIPALRVASIAMLLMPVALLLPLLIPMETPGAVPAFVLAYGLSSGIMSVMRPACVIELHGTEGYAGVAGRVMAPVTTAMAIGPAALAPLLHGAGASVALGFGTVGLLGAFLLMRGAMRPG